MDTNEESEAVNKPHHHLPLPSSVANQMKPSPPPSRKTDSRRPCCFLQDVADLWVLGGGVGVGGVYLRGAVPKPWHSHGGRFIAGRSARV